MQLRKLLVSARQIAKDLEKRYVFQGFFCPQHFSPRIMLYVTGLELTTLTNLLFYYNSPRLFTLC